MENGYKVVISNKNIYKEIELSPEMTFAKVGTGIDCTFRLLKDLFFDFIELTFQKKNDKWFIVCSDNLYITTGDVRKLVTKELSHGDIFDVCYCESNNTVLSIEFLFDFGGNRKYERLLSIDSLSQLTIGSENTNNIVLNSRFTQNDRIQCVRNAKGFEVSVVRSKYGVYINDKKIQKREQLSIGDFISVSDYTFYFSGEGLWTEIRNDMGFNGISYADMPNPNAYPKFNRNVRVQSVLSDEKIQILDPAAKNQKPKNNLFMSLLPSMGMMLTSGAMAMQGGGTMIAFSMISAGMAVFTAVLGFVDNKRDYKKSLLKRIEEYNSYIDKKREEIAGCRESERKQLEEMYIDIETARSRFDEFSSDLFDRQPGDPDFLFVRMGIGSVVAKRVIEYKKQEKLEAEDELQMIPAQISNENVYIENAPVVCDFKTANAVCILGAESNRFSFFKNVVLDICARHFFTDLEMIFVAEKKNADKIAWLRFLPYVNNPDTGMRNIICDDESKNRMFDYLYKELTYRESVKNDKSVFKHILVFFYDEFGFQRHPISKFVSKGNELGVTFVFMVENRSLVPLGCSCVIELLSDATGRLVDVANKENACTFRFEPVSDEQIKKVVNMLAPVYTEEISLEGALTKNISMFEMMNIFMAEDIDLQTRWAQSQVFKSMAAPIGVTKDSYVYLDLHDKAHGPHGLVAGTTGSGKSEILQTYILSVATIFHPYEVSFVIIDFKGGGMVNQFKDLPHLLGAITNIDGKEIDRSLKSIKAELQKRQRLFAEADVNHIDKYIKKFKAGEVSTPIPHLILIVDEFAELKAEQPDFMKELISAARIGRSLGVHLILATQKPSGQVDDQIWSNSRFKLCLKVQSVEDSNEVLKSPLAAEIKEPGRAYLQVGNNEVFELFQSAYSGAPEKISDSKVKEFSIAQVSISGKRTVVYSQKKKKNSENNLTQLDAIVRYVHDYCVKQGIQDLPNICLPSLSDMIVYPDALPFNDGLIDIGIYDDPDNQIQASTYIDIDNKNTLIIGSSQYGKTNMLQAIIKSVCNNKSAAEAVFYIMDFGSMVFKNFESLNNVGGVVTSSEDEKLKNLFKLLFEEIASRKEKLIEVGVSSFSSYIEAGYTDMPHIYLLVDNFTALSEIYLQDDDSLLTIVRDGISVGISTIVANMQTAGMSYKYISNFANKVVFYCNDSNEYNNVFDHVTVKPDEKPGRCIVEIDKRMLECQSYLAFEGEKEIERVERIKEFIEQANRKHGAKRAKKIPCIPNVLSVDILHTDFAAQPENACIPVGLTYADVKPFSFDLAQMGIFGVCGQGTKDQYAFARYLLWSLQNMSKNNNIEVVIFDDIKRSFADMKNLSVVKNYTLEVDTIKQVVADWHSRLEKRYQQMLFESDGAATDDSLLVMFIQNNDVARIINDDFDVMNQYSEITTRFKELGVAIFFANIENASISYDSPEPLRQIKQDQHLMFFGDLDTLKVFDPPYDAIRENKKKLSSGDAYYICGNDVTKLKMVDFDQ